MVDQRHRGVRLRPRLAPAPITGVDSAGDPRRQRRALGDAPGMKLSVIIPARDEERVIGATVERIVAALKGERIDHEVIVVDDWSDDGTAASVERIAAEHPQ